MHMPPRRAASASISPELAKSHGARRSRSAAVGGRVDCAFGKPSYHIQHSYDFGLRAPGRDARRPGSTSGLFDRGDDSRSLCHTSGRRGLPRVAAPPLADNRGGNAAWTPAYSTTSSGSDHQGRDTAPNRTSPVHSHVRGARPGRGRVNRSGGSGAGTPAERWLHNTRRCQSDGHQPDRQPCTPVSSRSVASRDAPLESACRTVGIPVLGRHRHKWDRKTTGMHGRSETPPRTVGTRVSRLTPPSARILVYQINLTPSRRCVRACSVVSGRLMTRLVGRRPHGHPVPAATRRAGAAHLHHARGAAGDRRRRVDIARAREDGGIALYTHRAEGPAAQACGGRLHRQRRHGADPIDRERGRFAAAPRGWAGPQTGRGSQDRTEI